MRGMEFHVMKRGRLAAALGCACLATSPALAQQAMPAQDAKYWFKVIMKRRV